MTREVHSRGFTLIEAAITTAIIGIAFTAMIELFATCTRQNRAAANITTASMLATHVRETMLPLAFSDPNPLSAVFGAETGESPAGYDDIDDFHGVTFNPPIDASREPVAELGQYSQTVSVVNVNPSLPSGTGPAGSAVRVTVTILYRANESSPVERVYTQSWLRMNQ